MHSVEDPNAISVCGDPVQVPLEPATWLRAASGALGAAAVLPPWEGAGEACLAALQRLLAAAAAVLQEQTHLLLPPLGRLAISSEAPPLLQLAMHLEASQSKGSVISSSQHPLADLHLCLTSLSEAPVSLQLCPSEHAPASDRRWPQ